MHLSIRSLPAIILVLLFGNPSLWAQETKFSHNFSEGEHYRIVGTNEQEVFQDGEFLGSSRELVRVQIAVLSFDGVAANLRAVYQMAEEGASSEGAFHLDREFDVEFSQNTDGIMDVDAGEFVPQVRNVPLFPEERVPVGYQWTLPAVEIYDFRAGFDIPDPVIIPVLVDYTYMGRESFENRTVDLIAVRYELFYRPTAGSPLFAQVRLITGTFSQRLYWDPERGRAHYYDERFSQFIQTRDGARFEFRGTANGRVVDSVQMDREEIERDIQDALADQDIRNTSVRSSDQGIIIAIENIRFAPDSAQLMPEELEKLNFIGSILQRYADRDILITGHTAMAGTEEGRLQLSEERAAAVGDFFVERGVRTRERLIYRGLGATEPVADNNTEEGRLRNRRVEITILEN